MQLSAYAHMGEPGGVAIIPICSRFEIDRRSSRFLDRWGIKVSRIILGGLQKTDGGYTFKKTNFSTFSDEFTSADCPPVHRTPAVCRSG
jgi:hypothetical protein